MMINKQTISDLAIPPGEYLEEVLDELGLQQSELARRMGRPAQLVNEIIKGEKAITPETSIQLEAVLGVPAYLWSNLESEYRLIKANLAEVENITSETPLLSNFPYLDLSKLGLVEKTRDSVEKVHNLRRFFGVASLSNLEVVKEYSPAFRQSTKNEISHEALAAWLRSGSIIARKVECNSYDKQALISNLDVIRSLTQEEDANIFMPKLKSILQECGIALVVIPHFKKTQTTGATFWLNKDKAVLMMSLRGSWADIFWFSLFHELGHILLHDKRHTFLENGASNPEWKKQEEEADYFAQKTLIPSNKFKEFLIQCDFSIPAIRNFAEEIGVSAGIITGRLQHEKMLPHAIHTGLIRYKWK